MPPHTRYPPGVNPYAPSSSTSSKTPTSSSASGLRSHRPNLPNRPNLQPPKLLLDDVDIEDFHPPEWRTVLNSKVDLGYPDFYPSRPGFDQPEDVLTEENVKNGFTGRNFIAVGAEVFSMHGPIHSHLSSGGLNLLSNLGKELIEKRQEMMPKIGERAFRIPVRVTYNDTKRLQFLNDLANPNVPLYKLMRNPVPHGFKGMELLDSMFSPNTSPAGSAHNRTPSGNPRLPSEPIPLDRALWFIRVLGSNEISAHRTRTQPTQHQNANTPIGAAPSPAAAATPSSTTTIITAPSLPVSSNDWYTQEFTNTFISWLRIQLGQLSLPNINKATTKPGVPPPKAAAGVLGDEKLRARWLIKWDYSTRLLRELHRRQLVSSRLLSGWMADYLGFANLAQVGFLAQLIGEYSGDLMKHLCNARHCLRNACEKLKEVRASPASSTLGKVEDMLIAIVKSFCESDEDVLLSPTTWKLHSNILSATVGRDLTQIKQRNEALRFAIDVDERSSSPRRQQMAEIQKLDSICEDTNMIELTRSFFDGTSSATNATPDLSRLEDKIFILLNWAMGLFQLGSHRPYAVYTILKHWHNQHEEHQSKQVKPQVIDLFPLLYKWLDTSPAARREENVQAIGITIGECTRQGMFSYGRYLQMLIAKGLTARTQPPARPPSHHLALLRAMPIFVVAKDLIQQRRIALSGDDAELRAKEDAEESMLMEQFKDEVMEYIPEVFGLEQYKNSEALRNVIDYQVPCSSRMSRYLYVQARFWLAPGAGQYLRGHNGISPMDASTFARVLQIFRTCRGHATIADFIIRAIQESEDEEILDVIVDTVHRDADMWTSMDGWSRLGDKLLDRYHSLQTQGKSHQRTLDLLDYLVKKGRLTADEEEEVKHIQEDLPKSTHALPPKLPFQESVYGLRQVLSGAKEESAVALAPKLYVRHGSFDNWRHQWWKIIIEILQHPSSHLAYDAVLRTVTSHIITVMQEARKPLEPTISAWLETLSAVSLIDTFGRRPGSLVAHVCLVLVVNRHLSSLTLLERVIYPIWKHTSNIVLTPRKRLSSKQVQAVGNTVNLFAQLLVSAPLVPYLPPTKPTDSLIVLAYRQAVFCGTSIQNLIRHLPLLVVLQKSALLPGHANITISSALRCLAMTAEFKTAAFRNLSVLKDAFLSTEWSKPSACHGLEAGMEDTLKLIMSEKPPNASTPTSKSRLSNFDNTARLSAWKWTRIVLEMRSDFKGLANRIINPENNAEDALQARHILNRQVIATLDRAATADDTDLLCEAFRGMDSIVTQEILVVGIDRLSSLLSQAIGAENQHHLEDSIKSIEQILRILHSTFNTSDSLSDSSILNARHKLLDLLTVALQSIDRGLSDTDLVIHHDISPPQPGDLLRVVLTLLRFVLGLSVIDNASPTAPKPNFPNLAVWFFKIMLTCQNVLDADAANMMSDMLSYIIDSTPPQSRLACQTALLGETNSSALQDILSASPILARSLPHLSPIRRNMALVTPDNGDEIVNGVDSAIHMDDKKWESFEQMNPLPKEPYHQDLYLVNKPIKDTSSISLSLFNPKITRDALPNTATDWSITKASTESPVSNGDSAEDVQSPSEEKESQSRPWEDWASEYDLSDGFNSTSFFRQRVSSLFDGKEELDLEQGQGDTRHPTAGVGVGDEQEGLNNKHSPLKNSNASPRKRRMSTRSHPSPTKSTTPTTTAGTHNLKGHGHGYGGGTNKNPIAIDESSSEDEEPLAVAALPSKRPRMTSTSTSASTTNTKSIKGTTTASTTSGKAPRKTTGGKGPAKTSATATARKSSTSGKSVKGSGSGSGSGTGGKAPKGRRKSSQVD
uniref:Mediator of RNA polymerase II transcription subunit 12 n=1 Tax=Kwoniella dejecticola CBS 10117 TaxID=1296121 RepID=A0A1A6ABV6_9TREE|nr:uncharacterized protein I303_01743 [Kwoniella dejecticola CBS 10117]OBR87535.1 hypothetical protein I303_01743 [Kwoniella dejecticola CBS 10117]